MAYCLVEKHALDVAKDDALASHHCVPGSIPRRGLSLLLVLYSAPRGFSQGTPVFPSPQNPTLPNFNSVLECGGISEFAIPASPIVHLVSLKRFGAPWVNKLHIYISIIYRKAAGLNLTRLHTSPSLCKRQIFLSLTQTCQPAGPWVARIHSIPELSGH